MHLQTEHLHLFFLMHMHQADPCILSYSGLVFINIKSGLYCIAPMLVNERNMLPNELCAL